jgi:hypothetical protein
MYIPQNSHTKALLILDSIHIHPSYKEDLSKAFIPPKPTQGQSRFRFRSPLQLPSVFRFALVFNVSFDFSLSCALFVAWDPSYRESLSKNSYIPQRFHTRTFLCFDSVSTHPSDEEDLSKTFMSARLTWDPSSREGM